jgi:tRNA pseudouridine38-40 synthase
VRVTGESFLRHMVRGIVGTLLEVGLGKLESGALRRILQSGERAQAGPNLPAHGLYFLEAGYEAWR